MARCRCLKCTVLHNERFQIGAVAEYNIAHGDELFRKGDGFQTPTRGEGSAVQFSECRGELNVFQVCKARKNLDLGCPGDAFADHKVLDLGLIVFPRRIIATLVTLGAAIPVDVAGSGDGQCLGRIIKCPVDLAAGSCGIFDQAALGSFRVIQSNKLDRTTFVFVLPLDIPIEIRQICIIFWLIRLPLVSINSQPVRCFTVIRRPALFCRDCHCSVLDSQRRQPRTHAEHYIADALNGLWQHDR